MDDKKKQAIAELVKTTNELDLLSIMLLSSNADALKAKERLEQNEKYPDKRAG